MNVAKVDRDVAYVAMVVYVCCKRLFPMFHLFFQTYVTGMFIWMLHMLHIYVANVLSGCCVRVCNGFQVFFMCVFTSVSDAYFKCFICLYAYVTSVPSK
jgi:hypothetical protein